MRKNFKLLGAVAVAGLVATTGSAFTGSNTLAGNNIAGYGELTVNGIAVTDIGYIKDTTDQAKVKTVTFKTSDSKALTATGVLTLKGTTGTVLNTGSTDCGNATGSVAPYVYTCTLGTAVSAADIVTTGFTALTN